MNRLADRGLSIVHLLVVRADLIVSAERRAQEKRRRKQIVYLCPIRLALAAYHSIDGQRLVYEGKLMDVDTWENARSRRRNDLLWPSGYKGATW